MMKLNLLGRTELLDANGHSVQLPTKKVFLLLSILAMSPKTGLSRSLLVEMVWGNSHHEAGRTSLRNALSSLKKLLPTNSLVATNDQIALHADTVRCDALGPISVIDPYLGEFMPSFSDDWVLDHRLRLRSEAVQNRLEVAAELIEGGDDKAALICLDQACEIDPLNQDAAQFRVQILSKIGKSPEAARVASTFHGRVLRELGVVVNIEPPSSNSEPNPLTVTCDWLVERNPEEAASFLAGTRSSWMAMGGRTALDCHQRVLDAYVKPTPTRTLVEAQYNYLRWIVGDFDHSQLDTQIAFTKAMVDHEDEAATILGTALAFGFLSQGKFKESIRHCQLVRDLANRSPSKIEIVNAERHLAIIEQHLGRDGSWEKRIKAVSSIVEMDGSPNEVAQQNLAMSSILLREGKLDQASTTLAQARRYFESTGGIRMVGYCLLTQAMIEEETGDFMNALRTVETIRNMGSDVIGHSLAAACNDFNARLQSKIGEFDSSAESAARATLIRRHVGSTPSIYEKAQMNPTRWLLKEQLSEQDLRSAYTRAKASPNVMDLSAASSAVSKQSQ